MNTHDPIVRCAACDGYGWLDADEDADLDFDTLAPDAAPHAGAVECRWCGGIGYVYRAANGIDRRIPPEDYAPHADTLERLEVERLREIGYTGDAKKPHQQQIRIDRGDRIVWQYQPTDETGIDDALPNGADPAL